MPTRPLLIAALAAIALLAPSAASAATLDVCPTSECYATPQLAVDAAGHGDTIAIAPGTYSGGIVLRTDFDADNLTIHGASAATTTLTGGLVARNAANSHVSGLTVRDLAFVGPSASEPGAVVSTIDASGGIENLTLRRVVLDGGGGDVRLFDGGNLLGTLTLEDSELRDSTADCVFATRCEPTSQGFPIEGVVVSDVDVHDVTGAVVLRSVNGMSSIGSVSVTDSSFADVGPLAGAEGALTVRNAASLVVGGNAFRGIDGPAMSVRSLGEVTISSNLVTDAGQGIVVPGDGGDAQGPQAWSISRNHLDVTGAAISLPDDLLPTTIDITANSLGGDLEFDGSGSLSAQRNWWGCNEGPGTATCSAATGNVDASQHLRLTLSADPATPAAGQPVTLTAAMRDSDGETVWPVADRTVTFSAGGGTLSPATATIGTAPASVTLIPPAFGGTVVASATLDAASPTVEVPFPVAFVPPFEEPVPPQSPAPTPEELQAQLGQFVQQGEVLQQQGEQAQERLEQGEVAPSTPIAGTCVDGIANVGETPLLVGQLEDCGSPPADPEPAIQETAELLDDLGEEIEELEEAERSAGTFSSTFGSWFGSMGPGLPPSTTVPIFSFGPLALIPGILRPLSGWFMRELDFTMEILGFQFRITPFGTTITSIGSGTRSVGAEPRAKRMTKHEAWARIVAIRARLRVLTGKPGPPSSKPVRLSAKRRVPVLVLGCQVERCDVALRPMLRIRGERTRLPKQALRVAQGKRVVAWVRLSRTQVRAVRRAGHAKLTVAIATGGRTQTVRARLTR